MIVELTPLRPVLSRKRKEETDYPEPCSPLSDFIDNENSESLGRHMGLSVFFNHSSEDIKTREKPMFN